MRAPIAPIASIALAAALTLSIGCATSPLQAAQQSTSGGGVDIATPPVGLGASDGGAVGSAGRSLERSARSELFRVGFWEIDFFSFARSPGRRQLRLLDFEILRLLEVGGGDGYHSFSFLEAPEVFQAFVTRSDGATHEHRVLDLQGLALFRSTKEGEAQTSTRLLKLPLVGDLYGRVVEGSLEKRSFLYLLRHESQY